MPSVSRTLWSVIITPSPRFFSCDTRLRISFTAIGSMPANGSSSKMNLGSFASARAISTRLRSPPDNAVAGLRRNAVIENSSSQESSFFFRFFLSGSTTSKIAIMFCSTVRPRNTLFSWGKYPICRRARW